MNIFFLKCMIQQPIPEYSGTYAANPHYSLINVLESWVDWVNQKKINPTAKAPSDLLSHGWLRPCLLLTEGKLHGRWSHWGNTMALNALVDSPHLPFLMLDQPIPQIYFESIPNPKATRMLDRCIQAIPKRGGDWRGWNATIYLQFFAEWLLFGFGHQSQRELPKEPAGCEGASDRLYQLFCLEAMLLHPRDYFADLLVQTKYGKERGFFPTPHEVCELVIRATVIDLKGDERALRTKSVADACCGTGRFLLHASNFTYLCIGQDIDNLLLKFALCNFYLYAPTVICPFPKLCGGSLFWGNSLVPDSSKLINPSWTGLKKQSISRQVSDRLTEVGMTRGEGIGIGAREYLDETEFDDELWWTTAPLLKRRPIAGTEAQKRHDPSRYIKPSKGKNKKESKPEGFGKTST